MFLPRGTLEMGGSREQYSQRRGGRWGDLMRVWHRPGQSQPPKLSQGLEKNNPNKWNQDKETELCPPPNPFHE